MEQETQNRIGKDFTTLGLFRFVLPAFAMNIFTQIFRSLDDALFISRYVGEKALAALNLLSPLNSIQLALGNLFCLGSSNISARLMGQGKQAQAKQVFTKIVISTLVVGCFFALLINIFANPILSILGADELLASYSIYQIRFVYSIAPISLVNNVFSAYYSTAGKPKLGMICSIVNGVSNIGLDLLLVAGMNKGVIGACTATVIGEVLVFLIGLFFFCNKNNEIHFVKPEGEYINTCLESFRYALPQCVNSLSFAVTNFYTNSILLDMIGADGVAANAIISDIRAIIISGLFGIAASIGPIIAYNYGNRNPVKLKRILKSVLTIWSIGSIVLITIGFILRTPLIGIYMSENSTQEFLDMAFFGLTIEIFSVPFSSGCVLSTRMFIALGNSKASTFISIVRNLVVRMICLFLLPKLFGIPGIWLAIPLGEAISFMICIAIIYINRDNYGYGKSGLALRMQ